MFGVGKPSLSTPHGALGTWKHVVHADSLLPLSTPHGTLGTRTARCSYFCACGLSTPHGTLGTKEKLPRLL